MNEHEIKERLKTANAVVYGDHFVYESGKHGSVYVDKSAIFTYPTLASLLGAELAELCKWYTIDVVVGPALGGIVLAQWVSHHLTQLDETEVRSVFAEKGDGPETTFALKRGYGDLVRGKRVLVVEDVITTGSSVRKVVNLVRAHGGTVAGVAVLVNRGGVTAADVGDPQLFRVLLDLPLESWPAHECPLCAKGVPVNTRLGKGARFLEEKSAK